MSSSEASEPGSGPSKAASNARDEPPNSGQPGSQPAAAAPVNMVAVKRPKAIVFDILGTASKSGFLELILFPFLKQNMRTYIESNWNKKPFIKLYNKMMEQSIEFNKQEPATPIVLAHDTSQAKLSLINFINYVNDNLVNSPAVIQFRFMIWFEGYQQKKLCTPIYSDVLIRFKQWFAQGIKFYVFSNTWVEAQKALLQNTSNGDLTNLISGYFDNEFGSMYAADSWRRFATEARTNAEDCLFLTKSALEARAASDAGLSVVLVLTHRHNVKAISKEDRRKFPVVRTLNELNWKEDTLGASHIQGAPPAGSGRANDPTPGGPIATAMSTSGAAAGSSKTHASSSQATSSASTHSGHSGHSGHSKASSRSSHSKH